MCNKVVEDVRVASRSWNGEQCRHVLVGLVVVSVQVFDIEFYSSLRIVSKDKVIALFGVHFSASRDSCSFECILGGGVTFSEKRHFL